MIKSILFVLSLPLILGGCEINDVYKQGYEPQPIDEPTKPGTTTEEQQTSGGETTEGDTTTGEETTGGGTTTGGETTGGETETGGETTGEGTTTGGETTGGGTEIGGGSQTDSNTTKTSISSLGFTNSEKITSFNLSSEITCACAVGTNTYKNAPAYYTSNSSIRLYFGNTLVISNSKGKISKVKFDFSSDNKDNVFTTSTGSMSSDSKTWTGSANSITFNVGGSKGKLSLFDIEVTYSTTGGGSETGGGTTTGGGGTETGGGTTTGGGGGAGQSGNGNTSSEWTTAWTGIQLDIALSLFNGNLPCLKAFNGYAVGCVDGSTKMYFNPYIKGWSKESQTYYDNALRDMGYTKTDTETDDEGVEWFYYQKGTCYVQTSHYRGDDSEYYFDVYAYNDYEAPFKLDYEPTVELTTQVYPIKSSYKAFSKTINGITFACSWATETNSLIQLDKGSKMEITSPTALSKMDIVFNYNKSCCLVYAGTNSSNAKVVYNNGNHWDLPSGTKYVKIQAFDSANVQIDSLTIK